MTESFFEIARTIGSFSGFFAAIVLIWDRYVKHFPTAILVAQPLVDGSSHITLFLLVKNVSDRPILVSWDAGDTSKFRIAKDQTRHGIFQTLIEGQTVICLGPEGDACLPVMKPRNYDEIDLENYVEIDLLWKFAQPRIWTIDRRLRVSLRKRDLDNMIDGYIEPSNGSGE
jgi:hypothetical protein